MPAAMTCYLMRAAETGSSKFNQETGAKAAQFFATGEAETPIEVCVSSDRPAIEAPASCAPRAKAQKLANSDADSERHTEGRSAAEAGDRDSNKKARLQKDTAANCAPSFHGCVFIRVGSTSNQKALEDLVTAFGGTFTENASEATHCLDGGAHFLSKLGWVVSQNVVKVFTRGGAVVPISANFPGHFPAQVQAEELADRIKTAEALSKKIPCGRLAQKELCNAYIEEFPELAKANGLGFGYSGYLPLAVASAAETF